MQTRGIDHIAIAVHKIDDCLPLYRDVLGMTLHEIEDVPDQKVNTAVLLSGDSRVELLEPTADDSPITKFLATRGPGLHHIALKVDDIADAIADCEKAGLRMIDTAPRPGAGGCSIAFIHPKSTGGVLVELTQRMPPASRP